MIVQKLSNDNKLCFKPADPTIDSSGISIDESLLNRVDVKILIKFLEKIKYNTLITITWRHFSYTGYIECSPPNLFLFYYKSKCFNLKRY